MKRNFPNHAATAVILAAGIVMLAACISCGHTAPANVAAEVDGHAITYAVLEKTYQTQYAQQTEGASPDQVMSQKLDVLSSLITNEIMLRRAEKAGLAAVGILSVPATGVEPCSVPIAVGSPPLVTAMTVPRDSLFAWTTLAASSAYMSP